MKFNLGKFKISDNSRPLLIAEISCNHCGSFAKAKRIILEAKKQGADFVKFQTYEADSMTLNSDQKIFTIQKGIWKGKKLWDLYNDAKTPFSWQKKLFSYAKKIGITAFSTPYDIKAVKILEKLNCPIYKVASFELTDLPLVKRISQTNKPIIISTGMANLNEINDAIKIIRRTNNNKFIILYCVSNYPSKPQDFHLNNIKILKKKFRCFVGLSDHSKDLSVASMAVAMGAKIFEKHIALKNQKTGLDISFSLKGDEIGKFVRKINLAWKATSSKKYTVDESQNVMKRFRRSIFIVNNVRKNEKISHSNVKILRPDGGGLKPRDIYKVIGKRFRKSYKKDQPLKSNMIK
tara:strand:- start:39 stop:1085 length:1047 start_codon:yes stop_codon:yes gene_type:complete